MALDDTGNPFELSPDPLLNEVTPFVSGIKLGEEFDVHKTVEGLLCRADIFGLNLYDTSMGEKVEKIFKELCSGPCAVRRVIHRVVSE